MLWHQSVFQKVAIIVEPLQYNIFPDNKVFLNRAGMFHVLPSFIINYFVLQHNHFYAVISELWVSWKDTHIRT